MPGSSTASIFVMIAWLVIIGLLMYFLTIKPQKKQKQAKELMMSRISVGDTVLTSAGFYGTIIGIEGDFVIIEFGSNKNCRIPTRKEAIIDVEKHGEVKETTEK